MLNLYIYNIKFITLLFAFAAIAIAFLYYFQFKKPTALYFAGFLGGLFTIHVGEWANYMIKTIDGFYDHPGFIFYLIVTAPCYFLISYFGLKFILSLFGRKLNRILNISMIVFFTIQLVLGHFDFKYAIYPYDIIPVFLVSLFMVFYVAYNYKNIVDKFLKKSIFLLFIISLVFVPTMIMFFIESLFSVITILTYVYLLFISVGSIFFGYTFFTRKPYMVSGKPTETFKEEFKITDREMEIIELIIKGQTAVKIADELCISARTVTTHISNIYKKSGVKNRVQLTNLFGSNWS